MKPSRIPKAKTETSFGVDKEKEAGPPPNIEIAQVGNGFIVRPGQTWFQRDPILKTWSDSGQDHFVFRSFAELVAWLGKHFSHRAEVVLVDRGRRR